MKKKKQKFENSYENSYQDSYDKPYQDSYDKSYQDSYDKSFQNPYDNSYPNSYPLTYERSPQTPYDNAPQNPYENQHQNSHDNPYFNYDEAHGIPDYPYTNQEKRRKRRPQRRGQSGFVIAVCVLLSLVAGFAGSIGAFCFAGQYIFAKEETTEDVFCEDPENEISRPESDPSIYGSAGEDAFAVSGVAHKVQDAVVVINVTILSMSAFGTPSTTGGSGVIISSEGYILTCHHVVDGAITIKVTLRNGEVYDAVLVGSDKTSDLAVLKISASKPLTYVEQGHSADLVAGEQVVAIGNPLGTLGGSVTVGYISATERNIVTSDGTEMTLIQTDAAINSGNSGGGLFNLAGELIGIVNAKYSASGVEGLAFAIPIDSAYPVQLDLMQYGYVRGVIDHGLTLLDITEANLAQYHYFYGIDKIGVYVTESKYAAELKNSDRIISINGTEVKTALDIKKLLADCKVGDTITIVADRKGKTFECSLVLQEYVPDRIKDSLQ